MVPFHQRIMWRDLYLMIFTQALKNKVYRLRNDFFKQSQNDMCISHVR